MRRRAVLKHAATVASIGALAGCVGDAGPGSGDEETTTDTTDGTTSEPAGSDTTTPDGRTESDTTDTESGTTAGTETGTERMTAPPPATIADRSISSVGSGCLSGDQRAAVSFGERRVSVTGTVKASDPCHEADFESVAYDADADELTVVVTVVEAGADTCVQCIGGIDYDATVSFHGHLPAHVTVVHATMGERTTVAAADR